MNDQEINDRFLHNEAETARLFGAILEVNNRAFQVGNIKDILAQIVTELRRKESLFSVNKALDKIEDAIKEIKE